MVHVGVQAAPRTRREADCSRMKLSSCSAPSTALATQQVRFLLHLPGTTTKCTAEFTLHV